MQSSPCRLNDNRRADKLDESKREKEPHKESYRAVLLAISICLIVAATICASNLRSRNNVRLIIRLVGSSRVGWGKASEALAECSKSLNLIEGRIRSRSTIARWNVLSRSQNLCLVESKILLLRAIKDKF